MKMKTAFFLSLLLTLHMHSLAQVDDFILVNGTNVHYQLYEKGDAPLVVLEAGARSYSGIWSNVIPGLIERGYAVLAYDRPGLGQSRETDTKRNGVQVARELKLLLDGLKVDQEIILVGHSMGGMYLGTFNVMFPQKVKALIMIDTPNLDWEESLTSCLTPEQRASRNTTLETMRASLSSTVQNEQKEAQASFEYLAQQKVSNPVTIMTGGSQTWPEDYNASCLTSAWLNVQKAQMSLSMQSRQIIVPNVGHNIPSLASNNVLNAIDEYR